MHASTPLILRKSRMRRRARTDLCGGRSVMVVPTATTIRWVAKTRVSGKCDGDKNHVRESEHGIAFTMTRDCTARVPNCACASLTKDKKRASLAFACRSKPASDRKVEAIEMAD